MFVTGLVLYDHVIAIEAYYLANEIALIRRVIFQPKESSIIEEKVRELPKQALSFSTKVITAKTSASCAPNFISVSLRTLLP